VPKVIYLGCQKNSNLAPKPLLKVLTSEPSTNKQQNLKAFILPEWVPKELWDGFDEMRRKMPSKSSWTDYARRLTIKNLEKLAAQGEDIQACLEQSIQRGYRGVFPVKQNGGNGNGNNGNGRLSGNELEEYNKRNFAEALRRGEERDRQNALWASDGDGGEGRPGPH
jgi:hypothetical protein